jgi:outer membrane protein TolC
VTIEQERAEAGVDPLSDLLQAQLTAAQLKLKRLHLETRAAHIAKQLAVLTGLPAGSITPDHASIPEIPAVRADETGRTTKGIEAAQMFALSKQKTARETRSTRIFPRSALPRSTSAAPRLLNNAAITTTSNNADPPNNNFSSGFSIQVPLFDWGHRAKAKSRRPMRCAPRSRPNRPSGRMKCRSRS